MNIGICTDKNDFFYDLHSLVKSFFPDDDVSIFCEEDTEKSSEHRDLLIRIDIPEYGPDRKETRDALKRELYSALSAYTGRTLPWGVLSGIRPTKIPMQMLNDGEDEEACVRHLRENAYVSPEKAELAVRVAAKEKTLLEHVPLGADCYSLYVHIPFCPTICLYCTFASSPAVLWKKRSEEYMMALASELRAKKEQMEETDCRRGPVTVYVGGGTPTTLTAEELDRLLSLIEETYDLSAALEYTVEAGRPDSITSEKLAVMLAHGVTRISVNPQTMNDVTLERIGRRHSAGETEEAFYLAREAGFTNINMDIILGLPGEGLPEVERTLRRIEMLRPDSLTVHSLAIKRASRLRLNILEDRQKDTEADRGDFRGLAMDNSSGLMQLAAESAGRMDMSPYYLYRQKNMRGNLENTGFAREGCECLYNILIMEEVQTICAVGAGASTKTVSADGRIERTVNPKDVDLYIRRMAPFEKTCDGKNR